METLVEGHAHVSHLWRTEEQGCMQVDTRPGWGIQIQGPEGHPGTFREGHTYIFFNITAAALSIWAGIFAKIIQCFGLQ